jgi:biotin carboxyl carrier protein
VAGAVPTVDGEPLDAHLARVPLTPALQLHVNGRTRRLSARRGACHAWALHLAGERFTAEVVDERTRAIQAMAGQGAAARGPGAMRAPMPGLVVRVDVQPGDRVSAGQRIAIIEAMKMENELRAETAGIVKRVHATPGSAVEKGQVLVEFEALE